MPPLTLLLALQAACTAPAPSDAPARIAARSLEVCDGLDNNGDGVIDEGCDPTCDRLVTRDRAWWRSHACVLTGAATGYPLTPIVLGSATALTSVRDLLATLNQTIAGDVTVGLEMMLLVARLNEAAFGIGDQPWDQDGDGVAETTVADMLAAADLVYDNRAALPTNVVRSWAFDLKDLNLAGTHLDAWLDETCLSPGEWCDGYDDDGDGVVDENCRCPEDVCNGLDDDGDGLVDEDQADLDGDGYPWCLDCDDTDPGVNPGVIEVPGDGIDQDCDGVDPVPAIGVGDLLPGDLVVTEIMANPSAVSDSNGEWFEVLNLAADPVDLDGLVVEDGGTDGFTVSGSLVVDPGGRVVFGRNGDLATNGGVAVDYAYSGMTLANSVDEIMLIGAAGIIDSVVYDSASWPVPVGASLQLDAGSEDAVTNDDPGAWCEATLPYGDGDLGTPGDANETCPGLADLDGDGWTAAEDCDDTDPNVHPGAVDDTVDGIDQDCDGVDGGGSSSGAVGLPLVSIGDLLITEIMVNPASPVSDSNGEWFEILNLSSDDIDLLGLEITDGALDAHTITTSLVVPAGGFAVLANNDDTATNGGLVPDYVYSGVSLANAGDSLVLAYGATVFDAVTWDGGATFPAPSGASLTLDASAADVVSNDLGSSWCAATSPYGDGTQLGTPGALNDPCTGGGSSGALTPADLSAGELVITEIMVDPAAPLADADGEWIEIANLAGGDVDLGGLVVSSSTGEVATVPSGVVVPAGGVAVLGPNPDTGTNGGVSLDGTLAGIVLDNLSDDLQLSYGAVVFDAVAWDAGMGWAVVEGASLSLDPSSVDAMSNDDATNWCAATSTYGDGTQLGTPGLANDACSGGVVSADFTTDIQPIFDANCALGGCHDAASASAGLVLDAASSYADLVGVPSTELASMNRVEPFQPESSYLMMKLSGLQIGVGGSGVAMPPSGSLPSEEIDLIATWISLGALP